MKSSERQAQGLRSLVLRRLRCTVRASLRGPYGSDGPAAQMRAAAPRKAPKGIARSRLLNAIATTAIA